MSTQLRMYSVSLKGLDAILPTDAPWMVEDGRAKAAAIDAEGYVNASRTVVEALNDILQDRPKDPAAGDAYGVAWELIIGLFESTRFDFGPMRLGSRFLSEASERMHALGMPRDLTPVGFMYRSPFENTPYPADAPSIGHLPAERAPQLLAAYKEIADRLEPDYAELAGTVIKAAEDVVQFMEFADTLEDGDLPYRDLVTFYS